MIFVAKPAVDQQPSLRSGHKCRRALPCQFEGTICLIFPRQSFDDGYTDPHTSASRCPTTAAHRQRKVCVERLARSSSRSSEINYARHRNLQPIPFCMRTRTAHDTNCTEKFKTHVREISLPARSDEIVHYVTRARSGSLPRVQCMRRYTCNGSGEQQQQRRRRQHAPVRVLLCVCAAAADRINLPIACDAVVTYRTVYNIGQFSLLHSRSLRRSAMPTFDRTKSCRGSTSVVRRSKIEIARADASRGVHYTHAHVRAYDGIASSSRGLRMHLHLLNMIDNMISNRQFRLKMNGVTEQTTFTIKKGLQQGTRTRRHDHDYTVLMRKSARSSPCSHRVRVGLRAARYYILYCAYSIQSLQAPIIHSQMYSDLIYMYFLQVYMFEIFLSYFETEGKRTLYNTKDTRKKKTRRHQNSSHIPAFRTHTNSHMCTCVLETQCASASFEIISM
ncbi:unnamed protein product [Trichogramma brassicae]|uniref:Uncharacterized protein n=1 Tax=Trichogramma brassicae TaxID=86971 RepID=A0A6H5IRB3_9HYME|nr:unnamed protein product [Trichogramma brassicae]